MKNIKFIINDNVELIQHSGSLSISTLIKKRLNKKGYLNNFISNNFSIEKCRLCNDEYPPVNFICHLDLDDFVKVTGFELSKDKIYCYGVNKNCPGIKMNSNSMEFISKVFKITKEEALDYIKSNNNSPFYKENWNNINEYKESQKRDESYFTKKYKEEGLKKYNKYKEKLSYSNSIERYINQYGLENGKTIFKEISEKKDSMSYKYFFKKNNNNHSKALFEYDNRKRSVLINVESYINKYGYLGEDLYNLQILNKRSSQISFISSLSLDERRKKYGITRNKMVNLYGVEDGNIKYDKWRESILVLFTRASKESMIIFNELINLCSYNNISCDDIYVGYGDRKEYFIKDDDKIFFYDFLIKSKKLIIEYNGVAFHPKINEINNFKPIGKLSSLEMYNKQKYKIELALNRGFKVLEIWSDDPNKTIKCVDFIKNNI